MDRIIIPSLMNDIRAYSDEKLTNKNSPSVRMMIKSFEKKTVFICMGSIRKKKVTETLATDR